MLSVKQCQDKLEDLKKEIAKIGDTERLDYLDYKRHLERLRGEYLTELAKAISREGE